MAESQASAATVASQEALAGDRTGGREARIDTQHLFGDAFVPASGLPLCATTPAPSDAVAVSDLFSQVCCRYVWLGKRFPFA